MIFKFFYIFICIWASSAQGFQNHIYDIVNLSTKVNLFLYTPNSTKLQITDIDSMDFENNFVFKFIVHGWGESPDKPYFEAMTKEFFKKGNYNVIHVDWSTPAAVDYYTAVKNTAKVGSILGRFIIRLKDIYSVKLKDIHILGHSLGAHVAGVTGKTIYKKTGNKIGRITGLDPAGPLFEGSTSSFSRKLVSGDAKIVDIIHTDGGVFGCKKSLGTVDFFPNGGVGIQPGCSLINNNDWTLTNYDELNITILQRDILRITQNIPFQIPGLTLGEAVTDKDIVYYLYNRKYENVTLETHFGNINRKYPIKILIHGWTEHYYVEWYKNIINAYLKKGFYNIILVDWSLKGDADYVSATINSKPVGDAIGKFVVNLHETKGVPYTNIHLLSHSLGCHVAGFVGKKIYEITGRKISRITAMDPAAPIFNIMPWNNNRLSKEDAHFVDVIHTDGGMLGFNYPIGTADFFPNGGSAVQPGCSLIKVDIKYEDFFCSHASSHQLFINSINSRRFLAKPCESWEKFALGLCNDRKSIIFGENVPQTITGNFYLETKDGDIKIAHDKNDVITIT